MKNGTQFYIKHNTNTTRARIDTIRYKVDVNTLEKLEIDHFELNDIGRTVITTIKPLFFDTYEKNRNTGSFVLIDPVTNNTCAVGMILYRLSSDELVSKITDHEIKEKINKGQCLIPNEDRQKRFNHKGFTLWVTGLHGSGKNELAYPLEKELFDMGANVVLLDGVTLRTGLSLELDFSPADRAEHLRRVAHIARILNDQGIIAICSFLSPNNNIRQQVAQIIGEERFYTIFVDAGIDYCKENQPDLYILAEKGKLDNLPGVDMQFDKPENPSITINPDFEKISTEPVLNFLTQKKLFPIK